MTKINLQKDNARPNSGRVFFDAFSKIKLPSCKVHLIFWSLTFAGFALDLWTKYAVFQWLSHKRPMSFTIIKGFLQFVLAENQGAAFGIAAGQRNLLIGVSVFALIVIVTFFLCWENQKKIVYIALALFTAGICGNLYDRIFNNGSVRDFIDVVYWHGKHWPAFNVADSMLCIAVTLMLISSFITHRPSQKHVQPHK